MTLIELQQYSKSNDNTWVSFKSFTKELTKELTTKITPIVYMSYTYQYHNKRI